MGAGLLPRRVTGRAEIAMLACTACSRVRLRAADEPVGLAVLLGIQVPGHEGSLSYVAGAPVLENLHRFLVYTLLTSTGGWDTGRAITTALAMSCSARRS